jgi:chorismate mutase
MAGVMRVHSTIRCWGGLAELVIERLALAQHVAAAKYVSGAPIDDPVREQKMLRSAGFALNAIGFDHAAGMQFFRDQIEASKVIQRGLHHRWQRHPEDIPAINPGLLAQVRNNLEYINTQFIRQFKCMGELPRLGQEDVTDLIDRRCCAALSARQLPRLHRSAALFATRSLWAEF